MAAEGGHFDKSKVQEVFVFFVLNFFFYAAQEDLYLVEGIKSFWCSTYFIKNNSFRMRDKNFRGLPNGWGVESWIGVWVNRVLIPATGI